VQVLSIFYQQKTFQYSDKLLCSTQAKSQPC